MQIEQQLPKKPNFGLIVGLSAVTIVILILAGILFIHWNGSHLSFGRGTHAGRSFLVAPNAPLLTNG